jgi:hypothetical protein
VARVSEGDGGAQVLAARLATDLAAALGDDLLSLAAHGSWVTGDFSPGRSDLDLLAVLARDPDAADRDRLAGLHAAVERDHPEWAGRVEVAYVGAAAVRDVLAATEAGHVMLRISPGEPLHALPTTRHGLLDWDAARRADRALVGRPPTEVLPDIPEPVVREVLLGHLRSWPEWSGESTHTGFQAYAVLTVARCRVRLDTGRSLSKREAARAAASAHPAWSRVLTWAEHWWYAGGADDEAVPSAVPAFVEAMTRR